MQESLEEAGRLIDRHLQDDRISPDISEWFPPPTVSGTSQKEGILEWTDFPALLASPRVPLPAQLLEQCAHIQCSCRMGVFPELCRAWMTIGSDIYIWNCENGGEVTCYDDLSDTILAVGLVRPRRGVLHRDIHYLLVLATPVDIVILGLSVTHFPPEDFTGIVSPGIDLIPDPLYTLPTNNASLLTIGCTDHGRIFLSGKDGCLYEVAYQAATDWYTQRYSKINHSKSSFSFLDPPVLQFTCSEDGSIVLMAIDNSRNIPYTRSDPSVLQYASPEDDSIVQIAIDNSRNILYTRSDKGDLHVYDLGDDGHGMCRVASLSQNSIVSAATNIARTIESSDFKPIVQIAVLEKSDSVTYHLLAVTHAGVQLYFTTMPFNQPAAAARPSTLSLLHVQLPLRFTASSTVEKPSKVHKAIYSNGVLLMTASEKEDIDTLSCINHRPFQKPKMKSHVITRVIGHTWALSKIDKLTPLTSFLYTPVLIQRHLLPPKKFVLLSAQGSDVFYIPRPVEQLRRLLDDSAGGDGKKLDCFFKFQQLDQACATCLFLACSSAASAASHSKNWYFSKEAASESEMSVWAARAFFRYGGEAQLRIQSSMPTPSNLGPMFGSPEPIVSPMSNPSFLTSPERGVYPPSVSTPAYPHLWSTLPQSVPSLPQSVPSLPGIMESEIVFSAKHNAICIYISQIIGNIWDRSIVVEEIVMNEDQAVTTMDTSVESEPLESALQELEGLLRFLEANFPFAAGSLGNPRFHTPTNLQHRLVTPGRLDMRSSQQAQEELQRKYTEAQLAEEKSLQRIYQLVRKICQVISLWQLLWDHMFTSIVSQLTKELQEQLKSTSFKNLVIRDKELTGALITSLINSYIQDNKTVDNISSYLQEVCPLLYSADDAVCSKANELLQRSHHVQNKLEKETMLRESLKQYQKISQQVDLSSVCAQYKEVRFFEGVVFLCLAAALKKDPQELGLLFYKNGEPEEDTVGLQAFQQRINIYNCITDTLQELLDQSEAAPQPASVPKKPGPPVLPSDPNMLSNEEAGIHFEQMLKLTQRSSDELFNVALFRWYIQADLTDKMLKLNSLFLEPFLVRMAEDNQNKVYFMELLWRYYEKNQNVSSAARVVAKLADMDNPEISLNQRLVYTSRAISAAKRSTEMSPFAADYNFLLKLVKKMDVAWIQLEIQETLKQQYSHLSSTQDVVSQLDSQIMDITKLYDEFAIPFKLPEFKLALRHCARHSDPISVENLWQEIIEQELSIGKTMNAADRMRALSLKLTSLGKTYAGAPQYFPLEFLVRYLEQKVCSLNWDVGFVTYTMQNIGVRIPKLLDVYGRLVKARDPCCYEMKKPLHLLECIHILRSGHDNVPSYQRPRLSAISSCLVALQCMNPMHVLQKTIGYFKSLHAKLARY